MSNENQKSSKINTILLSLCTMMITALGAIAWSGMVKADQAATSAATLQVSVNDIKASLMPREEISVQLKQLQNDQDKINVDLLDCRTRMNKLEIDLARFTGRALSPKEHDQQ